ncbi:hypoxia up-regulated protein 1-like isoform X2 [Mya arenaria]|uniref:hypoxia up-regulated protein 1-like isoform X2 n=1 Tax=Mya arenaria TaxID=6604 RepID=UPI0022E718F0|nr:hypoxia up-regulated protein 1-like isoform X2 [Mya arenaria]
MNRLVVTATILTALIGVSVCHLAVMSVDLGSEYMKIAIVKPGVPMEVIVNEDSARKTATIVCLRNGERSFGNPAEHCANKYPSNAFWYLTQIVGKMYDDPAVTVYQKRFPYYKLVKDEDRGTVLFQIDDETFYSPEELLAMILEKSRSYAETFADQTIKDTVITVPSYFNQAERRAVMLAAELSGINVLQLLGDNAAVALNYGVFRRKQFNTSMTYIMFYDMGATSTTATVVGYQVVKMKEGTRMVENPQLVIKGVGFDKELGGLEMSIRLRDHFAKYFSEHKKTKSDLYTNYRAMAKLLKEAKRVKKVLSANADHQARVEGLLDEEDFKMKVSRAEFEEMCSDVFERVTKPIDVALKASEITLGEISDVILMGGGTRIPRVQQKLKEYLGGIELGKSINTDEAAALGAVYQAAHLGKGFKVLTFGVKEANIYPILVEFEKQRTEDSTDPPKVIKRTLFGRMNPYPQKKVMTFNKHFKDFDFNVSYGELDFLSSEEAESMRQLQGPIQEIGLRGIAEAYNKHTDAQEAKGIKAHFRMDESGILTLDLVETVFEKEDKTVEEESTWSKLGDTISGLFGSKEEGDQPSPQANGTTEGKDGGETGNEQPQSDQPAKPESQQPEEGKEEQKEEPAGEDKKDEEPAEDSTQEPTDESTGGEPDKAEEKDETTEEKPEEKPKDDEKPKEEKNGDKKEDGDKTENGEKKPKIVIVKENITTETSINDIRPPSKDVFKAMKKKLADLTARDTEKKLLEKAKNELESFVYDMMDKLSQELYVRCSTEEQREEWMKSLSEASDWLYEQEEETPKGPYIDKLKDLKKMVKKVEFRVREVKERPEALAAIDSMLNHSSVFLSNIKNLSSLSIEEALFTAVEIETLEKLINETMDWKNSSVKEQSQIPDYETPKLLLEDIGRRMQALDREVKYLINKAKTYKPKAKPKSEKNKTTNKNATAADKDGKDTPADKDIDDIPTDKDIEDQDTPGDKTEGTTDSPDTEIPQPPTEEESQQATDTQEEETDDTVKATKKPERTTHDAGDL